MQTLKSFLNQAMLIWTESTGAGRVGIALLLVICVGGIVGIGVWSSQPNYVMLASELEPSEAAEIIAALDTANISYQVKGAGSIILVDKRKWNPAKIAAGKLGIQNVQDNMEESSPWMDPLTQQEIFRRNLQKQIESSIIQFKNIKTATVNLSIPKKQAFIRESNQPSASVLIEVAPKSKFNESNAAAIASLVSRSVSGLTIDQVSITDTDGTEYATDESLGRLTKQEEFRIVRERELSQKAEWLLTQFLGMGNAAVAVTTDYSFSFGTTEKHEYDADSKVLLSEDVTTTKNFAQPMSADGVEMSSEDSGAPVVPTRSDKPVSDHEKLNNQYGFSQTKSSRTEQTPVLNMMTVSVLINKTTVEDENQVVPTEIKSKIEEIVGNAVGLRGATDQITVEFFEFANPVPQVEEPISAIPWDQINAILKNISLGIAALVTLFIGLKVLKSFKPNQVEVEQVADQSTQINQLSEMVKENPEVFSKIIASWSNLDATTENESPASKAA